jgi:hypothetical protein
MALTPTLELVPTIDVSGRLATAITLVIPTLASSSDVCMVSLVPTKRKMHKKKKKKKSNQSTESRKTNT